MGIWIELGIFVLAIAFGLWQIHDVGQARKKTAAAKRAADEAQGKRSPDDAGSGQGGV